jgi:hypothetical protein
MCGYSAALVENAWRSLEQRGVPVAARREPAWRCFSQQKYVAKVRVRLAFDHALFGMRPSTPHLLVSGSQDSGLGCNL